MDYPIYIKEHISCTHLPVQTPIFILTSTFLRVNGMSVQFRVEKTNQDAGCHNCSGAIYGQRWYACISEKVISEKGVRDA
jgi:hypothetical protein